jgi:hypothetical protein
MMRMLPVMAVLDEDKDGELSAAELQNASMALKTLDKDENGELTMDELRPNFGGFGGGPFGANTTNLETLEPEEVDFNDGTDKIPDRATFKKLSYQGSEVLIDTHLAGLEYVKFNVDLPSALQKSQRRAGALHLRI